MFCLSKYLNAGIVLPPLHHNKTVNINFKIRHGLTIQCKGNVENNRQKSNTDLKVESGASFLNTWYFSFISVKFPY